MSRSQPIVHGPDSIMGSRSEASASMSLEPYSPDSLMARTRNIATLTENELPRFATEAARDRDADTLWALTETHLTLHGSAGSQISPRTLSAYHHALAVLLQD
jgi:hypothetical protein